MLLTRCCREGALASHDFGRLPATSESSRSLRCRRSSRGGRRSHHSKETNCQLVGIVTSVLAALSPLLNRGRSWQHSTEAKRTDSDAPSAKETSPWFRIRYNQHAHVINSTFFDLRVSRVNRRKFRRQMLNCSGVTCISGPQIVRGRIFFLPSIGYIVGFKNIFVVYVDILKH